MATVRSNRNAPGVSKRNSARGGRMGQFSYMRDPEAEHSFEVGETVEVYCDHEKDKDIDQSLLQTELLMIPNIT